MTPAGIEAAGCLKFARELALAAGGILMRHHEALAPAEIGRKGPIDMVTVADRESEALVAARLRARFPDHVIVAEESAALAGPFPPEVPRWYVDPLDGTTNYVRGFPFFAVSIACWRGDEPLVGVVHAPYLEETFTAARGAGAYLGGRRLRVTCTAALEEALLATGFHYDRRTLAANNVRNFNNLILEVRGIRRTGSAAMDLAYVAAGRLDGFWEPHLNAWDVAAGILLVQEAGGRVTDFAGGRDFLEGRSIVAAGPALHERIRERLVEGPGIS
ncbi:MAG: inositol monophosphatase [Planctomycetes bacterium]|nr:inositol monophosphatase [Planctomycetota bacterium]